jgi:translation elongation factor EF-1alpha
MKKTGFNINRIINVAVNGYKNENIMTKSNNDLFAFYKGHSLIEAIEQSVEHLI